MTGLIIYRMEDHPAYTGLNDSDDGSKEGACPPTGATSTSTFSLHPEFEISFINLNVASLPRRQAQKETPNRQGSAATSQTTVYGRATEQGQTLESVATAVDRRSSAGDNPADAASNATQQG
jgi:hypothetical protein